MNPEPNFEPFNELVETAEQDERAEAWENGEIPDYGPVVCIGHGKFAPCRTDDERCLLTRDPAMVDLVGQWQTGWLDWSAWSTRFALEILLCDERTRVRAAHRSKESR